MTAIVKKIILKNSKFIKFCIVGAIGLLTNLSIFYTTANYIKLDINFSAIIAFLVSNLQNYIVNSKWTFIKANKKISFKRYLKYLSSYLFGLAVNLVILNVIVILFGDIYKFLGQILAIIVATIFNFKLSKYFVFNSKN